MAYISTNYAANTHAPAGKWTCSPGSELGPFDEVPSGQNTKHPNYCGQCVSYVRQVCPTLPATGSWKKGGPVKDNKGIQRGTAIATFDANNKYLGHAAIFVSQGPEGITVYDQYIYGASPKAVGSRVLRWSGKGDVNDGNSYYVVE